MGIEAAPKRNISRIGMSKRATVRLRLMASRLQAEGTCVRSIIHGGPDGSPRPATGRLAASSQRREVHSASQGGDAPGESFALRTPRSPRGMIGRRAGLGGWTGADAAAASAQAWGSASAGVSAGGLVSSWGSGSGAASASARSPPQLRSGLSLASRPPWRRAPPGAAARRPRERRRLHLDGDVLEELDRYR